MEQPISKTRHVSYHQPLILLLVLFAFFMSALVSRSVFERLPHLEDEVAYLFQAKMATHGDLVIESPQPRRAFWQPFIIDRDGQRFGKYPIGWPALLALGVAMGQTWVINAFFSALNVALVYQLGREVFNPDVGALAAMLTAFSPMALLLNGTLMGHTAALFFTTLFMYAYWRIERANKRKHSVLRWGIVAGISLGMMAIMRPLTAIGISAPFVLWSAFRLLRALMQTRKVPLGVTFPLIVIGGSATVIALLISLLIQLEPIQHLYLLIARRLEFALYVGLVTSALIYIPILIAIIFTYAVWRFEHSQSKQDRLRLGILAGVSLGIMAVTNIQFAAIIAVLFLVWSVFRLRSEFHPDVPRFVNTLRPLIALGVVAVLFALTIPLHSYLATGNPRLNLYTLVWDYDQVGFGECCGRNGHTLEKGIRQARFDLSLMAADLFGWQVQPLTPEMTTHLLNEADYWPGTGLSWILLPFGLLIGIKKRWTWLLVGVTLALIGVHLAYWIGSQRYSTRYYFEALTALTLISALPLAWLVRRLPRIAGPMVVYGGLLAALVYGMYAYSTPRINTLYRFNRVGQEQIAEVQARRFTDRPALVIINGTDVRWRAFGSLMAVTSPYLDSDIVAAWNYGDDELHAELVALFPDREVIEMDAHENESTFRAG